MTTSTFPEGLSRIYLFIYSFISKISHSRVCLYLNSQECVNNLIETHKRIQINSFSLEIRPLIANTNRIIISNVHPVIPNSLIENKLSECNITPKSQILYVRAGYNEAGFTHILSFRRQMYIDINDINKLPGSLQVEYEGTSYWLYLSSEKLTCFVCREEAHLAKHCKNNKVVENTETDEPLDNTPQNEVINTPSLLEHMDLNNITTNVTDLDEFKVPQNCPKIQLSISSRTETDQTSEAYSQLENYNDNNEKKNDSKNRNKIKSKPPKKKAKTTENQANISVEEMLIPAKQKFEKTLYAPPIPIDKLALFLEEVQDNYDISESIKKYSNDPTEIIDSLNSIYSHIKERALKSRITRILKKIQKKTQSATTSEDYSTTEE